MDFMIGRQPVAGLLNIGLLGGVMFTYIQNIRLIKSYFTYGLIIVAALFIVQNIVIVIFWSQLYLAGPAIKDIVDSGHSLSFCYKFNSICWISSIVMDY